jgi:hypothetical protein
VRAKVPKLGVWRCSPAALALLGLDVGGKRPLGEMGGRYHDNVQLERQTAGKAKQSVRRKAVEARARKELMQREACA